MLGSVIMIMMINQPPIVRVTSILVLLLLGSDFKTSAKENHKNYNYCIMTQILKGTSYPLKDLKWMLWDAEDTFCLFQC